MELAERPLVTFLISDENEIEFSSTLEVIQKQWQSEKTEFRIAIVGGDNQALENLSSGVQLNGFQEDIPVLCDADEPDWKKLMPWVRELMANRKRLHKGLPVSCLT